MARYTPAGSTCTNDSTLPRLNRPSELPNAYGIIAPVSTIGLPAAGGKACANAASIVAVTALTFAGVALAQSDPAVGTWKLNTAKSKYDPGPLPKSNTVTITAVANGVHVVAKGEDAAGKPTGIDYTATFDGKDSPVKGAPASD